MEERNQNPYKESQVQEDLDRALDAALAEYSSVEPRPGLGQRIMANLNAQSPVVTSLAWWRYGLAVGFAVVLLVVGLAWRSGKASRPVTVRQQPASVPRQDVRVAENPDLRSHPAPVMKAPTLQAVARKQQRGDRGRTIKLASAPKPDQFPSPRPLSEQEKLLASYVAHDSENAILVARAQTEFDKQSEEEMRGMNRASTRDLEQIEQ